METYNKPYKYSPARSIVTLALGISSLVFGVCASIFMVVDLVMAISMMFAQGIVPSGGFVLVGILYAWMFLFGTFLFSAVGVACTLVGKYQAKKFVELYEIENKMLKNGLLIGKIGMIVCIAAFALTLVAAILVTIFMMM